MYSFKDLVVASDPRMGDDEWLEYMRQKRKKSAEEPIDEEEVKALEALDMKARRKLAQAMRKNKAKIKRAKEIASKKKASKDKLEKRAQKQAIEIVKKKIAQGKDIKKMSFAARQQLDDKVKKKQGLVKKLAKRLLKKVKADEKERMTKKSEK
jgi:hypothetical protein